MTELSLEVLRFLIPGVKVASEQLQAMGVEAVNYVFLSAVFSLLESLLPSFLIFTAYRVVTFFMRSAQEHDVQLCRSRTHVYPSDFHTEADHKLREDLAAKKNADKRTEAEAEVMQGYRLIQFGVGLVFSLVTFFFSVLPSVRSARVVAEAVYTPRIAVAKHLLRLKQDVGQPVFVHGQH